MSTPISPADLARYAHRVPAGATIPAGTKYVYVYEVSGGNPDAFLVGPVSRARDVIVTSRYWTAEPLLTPEQARLKNEYEAVCKRIDAATAKIRKLERERETDEEEAGRLYARLKKEGLR